MTSDFFAPCQPPASFALVSCSSNDNLPSDHENNCAKASRPICHLLIHRSITSRADPRHSATRLGTYTTPDQRLRSLSHQPPIFWFNSMQLVFIPTLDDGMTRTHGSKIRPSQPCCQVKVNVGTPRVGKRGGGLGGVRLRRC
ncbi:hypothetical protein LshimejAT787_0503370 [Lyophyllum shimeji]|uniref:Uncharacterized protein n=1 Tax=Lyophyllum shimeji TaxID=47721 RepID=A0A9P3UML6_LYOSH|nr:hypothetical protein LshimejAT787_0503370 [Lyophyllum shimeji]